MNSQWTEILYMYVIYVRSRVLYRLYQDPTCNDETRPPELAHWAPVQDPEEDPGVTIGAPGHHISPATPGGNSEAGEVTVLAKSSALEALGQVQLQSPAASAARSPSRNGQPIPKLRGSKGGQNHRTSRTLRANHHNCT